MDKAGLRRMTIQPSSDRSKQWLPILRSQPPLHGQAELRVKSELSERIAPVVTPSGRLGPQTNEAIVIPAEATRSGSSRCTMKLRQSLTKTELIALAGIPPGHHQG